MQESEKYQIVLLFLILCSKREDKIDRFLQLIKPIYKWLVDKVLKEKNDPDSKHSQYYAEVKKIKSSNPKHSLYNVHRFKPVGNLSLTKC